MFFFVYIPFYFISSPFPIALIFTITSRQKTSDCADVTALNIFFLFLMFYMVAASSMVQGPQMSPH